MMKRIILTLAITITTSLATSHAAASSDNILSCPELAKINVLEPGKLSILETSTQGDTFTFRGETPSLLWYFSGAYLAENTYVCTYSLIPGGNTVVLYGNGDEDSSQSIYLRPSVITLKTPVPKDSTYNSYLNATGTCSKFMYRDCSVILGDG